MDRRIPVGLVLVATLPLAGCMYAARGVDIDGQRIAGVVETEKYKHKILGPTSATAKGAYSPLLLPFYRLFGVSVVEGGDRHAGIATVTPTILGIVPFPVSLESPVVSAAKYDALEKVPGADTLIAIRVKQETSDLIFGIWRTETVTVTAKAVQLLD